MISLLLFIYQYFHKFTIVKLKVYNILVYILAVAMSLKQVQSSIKLSLNIINKAIRQIPLDKRPIITSRVNAVLNKYLKGPES